MIENTIAAWHKIIKTKDAAGLDNILADNVVFHSPIVHTPQEGKPITKLYLTAALYVFNNDSFKYLRECMSSNGFGQTCLELRDGFSTHIYLSCNFSKPHGTFLLPS